MSPTWSVDSTLLLSTLKPSTFISAHVGVTESNNVLAIVVSEETGDFAMAEHGVLKTDLNLDQIIIGISDYLNMKNEI